jgi:hypothetical protein
VNSGHAAHYALMTEKSVRMGLINGAARETTRRLRRFLRDGGGATAALSSVGFSPVKTAVGSGRSK